MRYGERETAILAGVFGETGLDVRIKIVELSNDNLVELKTDVCIESEHIEGLYLFSTANIMNDALIGYNNLVYLMYSPSSNVKQYGKIAKGGIVDDTTDVSLDEITEMLTALQTKVTRLFTLTAANS